MKPMLSVLILIFTLFAIVFMQMEERRLGYVVLKLNREHKQVSNELRVLQIQIAQLTRPQLLDKFVRRKLTLQKVKSEQIIHLSSIKSEAPVIEKKVSENRLPASGDIEKPRKIN
ncbi:MAG: histidine kinase [Pseudobdellovibrionaceae bacterium]|jgi:hypothetical protein